MQSPNAVLTDEVQAGRELVAYIGRMLFERNLTDACGGNISLRVGDVYCMSPTLAALFAFLFLDEALNLQAGLGLAIAISALIGFGWTREASRGIGTNISAICLALLCGVASAAFTVLDTYGMRETPVRFRRSGR